MDKTIEEMIEELNCHYENMNSEKRYWINYADEEKDDRYFVCYNALSAMDEIDEVTLEHIKNIYNNTFNL